MADLLEIGADERAARETLDRVPLWFHTFSLDGGSLYTPGVARDHRYRVPALPADLHGRSVLDVGTFDGFYAFLCEARGARRVVAVDNEQYREWVQARWGVELEGAEGFRAIAALLKSEVDYLRLDAFQLDQLGEAFDLVICFGVLHRVEDPLGLLRVLRRRLDDGGHLLLETYGAADRMQKDERGVDVFEAGEVYERDAYVYWGFSRESLMGLARRAGFGRVEVLDEPVIDGHPRIVGTLAAGK